jgi:hypothetical protein
MHIGAALALLLFLSLAVVALQILYWWALALLAWGPAAYAAFVAGWFAARLSHSVTLGLIASLIVAALVRGITCLALAHIRRFTICLRA